jgi:hypothetical protein
MARKIERDLGREVAERARIVRMLERMNRRLDVLGRTATGQALSDLKRGFKHFSGDVKQRLDSAHNWHEAWDKIISNKVAANAIKEGGDEILLGLVKKLE